MPGRIKLPMTRPPKICASASPRISKISMSPQKEKQQVQSHKNNPEGAPPLSRSMRQSGVFDVRDNYDQPGSQNKIQNGHPQQRSTRLPHPCRVLCDRVGFLTSGIITTRPGPKTKFKMAILNNDRRGCPTLVASMRQGGVFDVRDNCDQPGPQTRFKIPTRSCV